MELKEKIKKICFEKNMSIAQLLRITGIQSGDYYQALNGDKKFFNGWKQRISETLNMSVEELFNN